MKKSSFTSIITVILFNLLFSGTVFSQSGDDRAANIQKDIEIFNNILNKLIIRDSPFYFTFDDHVKGVYLDGFGMLFDMESYGLAGISESISQAIRDIEKIKIVTNDGDTVVKIETGRDDKRSPERYVRKEQKSIIEQVGQTKKLITQFYVDYASAVKSLAPTEQIVVNIRIREKDEGLLIGNQKEKTPTQLRSAIKADDLIKFRQGKLTESQLIQKIQFTETYDEKGDHEIEIMENILNTALGKSSHKSALALTGGTRGIYLENFGVLFFSPASIFDKSMRIFIKNMSNWDEKNREFERKTRQYEQRMRDYEKKLNEKYEDMSDKSVPGTSALPIPPEPPEAPEAPEIDIDVDWRNNHQYLQQGKTEIDSILNSMSDQIIELLGQYGHTMRKVKDNEWVMVAVDFNYRVWDSDDSRLYIKVKKADLLKYNRDQINLNTLKQTMKIWRG